MRNFFLPVLLGFAELNAAPVFARPPAKPIQKPADLPFRFRDFQIYSTSTPDTANPSRIIVSVQLHNKGNKPLMATVRLGANKVVGFAGNATRVLLKPHSQSV